MLWLQLTGGEPMIDRLFTEVYRLASDLGMLCTILSNGVPSDPQDQIPRLAQPELHYRVT